MNLSARSQGALGATLDLQRSLLGRSALLVGAVLLGLGVWEGLGLRRQAVAELPATAELAARLMHLELGQRAPLVERTRLALSLDNLRWAELEQRVPLCLEVLDLNHKVLAQRCPMPAAAHPLSRALAELLASGPEVVQMRPLLLADGVKVGEVALRPPWQHLGLNWASRLGELLAFGLALSALLLVVTRPVGRALRPADDILAALARLEAGEDRVRLPEPPLRELGQITRHFNRLADRWGELHEAQRHLAARLLHSREEERRHLARELHDEMGQTLSALRAEAEVARALGLRGDTAALAPVSQRIASLSAELLLSLQGVLHRLRPIALDRFGLSAALHALSQEPRRGADGQVLDTHLHLEGPALDQLPADTAVHLYRLVQEGLTNASRHAQARRVEVCLRRDAHGLRLSIRDDGQGPGEAAPTPGHGLLGMDERVRAMGGRWRWQTPATGGLELLIEVPDASAARTGASP